MEREHKDERDSKRRKTNIDKNDQSYFDSYSHIGIHEDMLKDELRTKAYKDAIFKNPQDFKDKVVLDLGAGTGILSMFCAQAGARKVYAVEASEIAEQAELLVQGNNLADKITILRGRIEDLEIPEKVDVVVSEWMGYFLLYESMFDSVIYARDKWLKPDGKMYPSHARMFFAPFTDEDAYINQKLGYWKNVYGLDYSAIIPFAKKLAFSEPQVESVAPQDILSFPLEIKSFDCKTVTVDEIRSTKTDFKIPSIVVARVNGFASWFDVIFQGSNQTVRLSTAPEAGYTHWHQTLFFIDEPFDIIQDQEITGTLNFYENKDNKRFIDIELSYKAKPDQKLTERLYKMK